MCVESAADRHRKTRGSNRTVPPPRCGDGDPFYARRKNWYCYRGGISANGQKEGKTRSISHAPVKYRFCFLRARARFVTIIPTTKLRREWRHEQNATVVVLRTRTAAGAAVSHPSARRVRCFYHVINVRPFIARSRVPTRRPGGRPASRGQSLSDFRVERKKKVLVNYIRIHISRSDVAATRRSF